MERRTLVFVTVACVCLLPAACLADGGEASEGFWSVSTVVGLVLLLLMVTAYVSAFGHFIIAWWQLVGAGFSVGLLWGLFNLAGTIVFPFGFFPFILFHWTKAKPGLKNLGYGALSIVAAWVIYGLGHFIGLAVGFSI